MNNFIIRLNYNIFYHKQVVQEPNFECEEIYLIHTGGIAVCEPSSFEEPILVYGKGGAINIYNVVLQDTLDFKFVAVCDNSFKVETTGEILHNLVDERYGFFPANKYKDKDPRKILTSQKDIANKIVLYSMGTEDF